MTIAAKCRWLHNIGLTPGEIARFLGVHYSQAKSACAVDGECERPIEEMRSAGVEVSRGVAAQVREHLARPKREATRAHRLREAQWCAVRGIPAWERTEIGLAGEEPPLEIEPIEPAVIKRMREAVNEPALKRLREIAKALEVPPEYLALRCLRALEALYPEVRPSGLPDAEARPRPRMPDYRPPQLCIAQGADDE